MIVDLDGRWWVREALGDTWEWYLDAPLTGRNNAADAAAAAAAAPGWLPAQVPGSVVTDLWRAGEVPDPYVGRQSRAAEWVATRHWVHRRVVDLPEVPGGWSGVLELDGVDPGGSVHWDGQPLGRVEGLYRRARFALPARLTGPGEHRLAVVLDPVPANEPQVGRTERVRHHRPRMTEGWDFCPRLPHQGIWRGVRLVLGPAHLAQVAVATPVGDPAPDRPGAGRSVVVTGELSAAAELSVRVLRPDGRVERTTVAADPGPVRLAVEVPDAEVWWPRGLGGQALHRVEVLVDGEVLWSGRVGFRTARLVVNTGAPPGALGYTAEVNGVRLPAVGWNWAPADAQYGAADPARVRHLVDLAARSGARLLRVWGGGLVETEVFYDACDEAGLLVWQEFSQSSSGRQSAPATDEEFVALLRAEAGAAVPPLTHHASLLLWGGGNELEDDAGPLDEARSPALAALREEVARLDPGRSWLATSPTGPVFAHRLDVIAADPDGQHDVHGPWEHQGLRGQHTLAAAGTCLAHTEFGVEGMAGMRSLGDLVPARSAWPAHRGNPVYRHLGEWWDNEPFVQECFGGRLTDLPTLSRASRWLQATGLVTAVEADRRRWPRCSMVLVWQLAESYPNAWCTSAVEHSGEPKPAYHAVARAFAPRRVSLTTATDAWDGAPARAEAWVWSDPAAGEVAAGSRVELRLLDDHGTVLGSAERSVAGPVGDPVEGVGLEVPVLPPAGVVVWEARWLSAGGEELDVERRVASTSADLQPLLDLPAADVTVEVVPDGLVVRHVTGPAVIGMGLADGRTARTPGWLVAEVDPRPLMPGEVRRLPARWRDATGETGVVLDAWNLPPTRIELP